MEMNPSRQRYILLCLRAIRMFLIAIPVIVIYWQNHGLSVRDIFLLQVIFSLAIVILEVPSGYFADSYGRRTAIIGGCVVSTLGFFCYWALPGFAGFAIAEIFLALGGSLLSGSVEVMLNESIPAEKRLADNGKWQGRLMTAGNLSEAVAAVCAGFVAAYYSIETVLFIQWLIMFVSIPLAFQLKESRQQTDTPTPTMIKIVKGSLRENRKLVSLNIYTAAVSTGTLCMVWFTQPHWQQLGIDIIHFGYMWAGLQLLVAASALFTHHLERWFGFRYFFAISAIGLVVAYLLMGALSQSLLSLLILPSFWIIRGLTHPIIVDYVQREAGDQEKATVLSVNKLAGRLVFSVASPFLGWTVDIWSFEVAFYASAIIFGLLGLLGVAMLLASSRRPLTT